MDGIRIQSNLRSKLFGVRSEPVRIGRFSLLGTIGSGGMGVVYAARDEELDRKIAIKLMPDVGGAAEDQSSLLREAQALARLSHPNVVQVYEVGTYEGRVFVAMEFLPGPTLDAWQKQSPRAWRETLAKYIDAGEGLAAAHEEGILHRDLKPANLMLGGDDRVRVVDFGLAHHLAREPTAEDPTPNDTGSQGDSGVALAVTRTASGLAGTPGYMSPEQVQGEALDARSDQYSFCVALYEALYGRRPHEGKSAPAVLMAIARGRVLPPPRGASVPKHITRAVMRGLSHAPDQRFASVRALLSELRYDPSARRWQLVGGAGVVSLVGWSAWPTPERDPCQAVGGEVDDTWGSPRRDVVEAAFAATSQPYAPRAWQEVAQRLDAWADGFVAQRVAACRAHHVDVAESAELYDLRVACLRRQQAEVQALVDVLSVADDGVVRNAAVSVAELPEPVRCSEGERLRRRTAPPVDPRVGQIEQILAEAAAQYQVGHLEDALAGADTAIELAEALNYAPLLAQALRDRGTTLVHVGRYPDALVDLHRAADVAEGDGDDEALAEIWIRLARTAAGKDQRPLAEWSIRRGQATLTRVGAGPLDHGRLDMARANLARWNEDFELATELARAALAKLDAALGRKAPQVLDAHIDLAVILAESGATTAALAEFEAARDARLELLGASHPELAKDHHNIGRTLVVLGRMDEARAELNAGVALRANRHAPLDVRLIDLHLQLMELERTLGDEAAYARELQAAFALSTELPRSDWRWTQIHILRAEAHLQAGQWAEAIAGFEATAAVYAEQGRTDEGNYWVARQRAAAAYLSSGNIGAARARYRALVDDAANSPSEAAHSVLAEAQASLDALGVTG